MPDADKSTGAVGILCITHKNIGQTLVATAHALLSEIAHPIETLEIPLTSNIESFQTKAQELCQALNQGKGVLVLTDLPGATPSNIAISLYRPQHVEVISGINLSMLMKLVTYYSLPLNALVEKIIEGGRNSIVRYPY